MTDSNNTDGDADVRPFHSVAACREWGQTALPRTLTAFEQASINPDTPFLTQLDAAFDVLRVSAGCLACLRPFEGYGEFDSVTNSILADCSAEIDPSDMLYSLSSTLIRMLELAMGEVGHTLDGVLRDKVTTIVERAVSAFIEADPDLHHVPVEEVCVALWDAFRDENPIIAMAEVDTLREALRLVGDEAYRALIPAANLLRLPTPPDDSAWPSPEIRFAEYNAKIAQLEARQDEVEGHGHWVELRQRWLYTRLSVLAHFRDRLRHGEQALQQEASDVEDPQLVHAGPATVQ